MVVEMVKKYVSIATTSCCVFGSRHPLLMFNVFVLFWMYRSFPFLFSILLYASPVIASTLLLLGTLLFFGQSVVPERNDQGYLDNTDNNKLKQQVKSEWVDQKARFQEKKKIGLKSRERSRRNSIDFAGNALGHNRIDDDNKGWETGSDLGSEVPRTHGSTDAASDHSHESGDMVNETDAYDDDYSDDDLDDIQVKDDEYDEHENVFMWTDDDQRNAMNMRTSELERNRRLENLIARQKALRNLRMMAEKNMENLSPDLPFNATHSNLTHYDSAPSVMIPLRQPFDFSYDPSDMKHNHVGHTFQTNEPLLSQHRDVGPLTFGSSKQGYNLGQYLVPGGTNYLSMIKTDTESIGSAHTEDDPSREHCTSGLSKVKVRGSNETGHQEKASSDTSSSSFCDVTDDINDDEEDEEFRSIENPSEDSEDLQITDDDDSETNQTEEGGLPHRLKSWLTRWKA